MSEWIYFGHPPRERFVETMTDEEGATMQAHRAHLAELFDRGVVLLAGPTFGTVNTAVNVIEAEDEGAARAVMESDPAISSGLMTGELRPMRISFLHGRPVA
jgi:uncharacterized protein YciI